MEGDRLKGVVPGRGKMMMMRDDDDDEGMDEMDEVDGSASWPLREQGVEGRVGI